MARPNKGGFFRSIFKAKTPCCCVEFEEVPKGTTDEDGVSRPQNSESRASEAEKHCCKSSPASCCRQE